MLSLLAYPVVVYDTNCIVYHCFLITERRVDGATVILKDPNTDKIRGVTEILVIAGKRICTLQCAWDEVRRVTAAKVVSDRQAQLRIQLGLPPGDNLPPDLVLKLTRALQKNAKALAREVWFQIDAGFTALYRDIAPVRKLYEDLARDPAQQHRFARGKNPVPSEVDIQLILYSGSLGASLLTNDRGLSDFDNELRAAGFCHAVRGLETVQLIAARA